MMGFPCLRLDGDFFASCDHRTGNLVVKLNEARRVRAHRRRQGRAVRAQRPPVPRVGEHPGCASPGAGRGCLDEALRCSAERRVARPRLPRTLVDARTRTSARHASTACMRRARRERTAQSRRTLLLRTRRRPFCYFHDNHNGDGRISLWCPTLPGVQEELVTAEPERFFRPPPSASGTFSTWLGVYLDTTGTNRVDWKEISHPRGRISARGSSRARGETQRGSAGLAEVDDTRSKNATAVSVNLLHKRDLSTRLSPRATRFSECHSAVQTVVQIMRARTLCARNYFRDSERSGLRECGMADVGRVGTLGGVDVALSLATDLGTGQPMEHGLRTCWLSLAASEALGLDAATRSCVYYVALLRFVGCTSDASETAVLAAATMWRSTPRWHRC